MIVQLPVADEKRFLEGCKHYNLEVRYNNRTKPYAHVTVNDAEDVVNIFWLGANLSHEKIETPLTKQIY